ncbi:MAG: sigma-70 family RNA polymerase sigma factor [Anaerolineae bacterium]
MLEDLLENAKAQGYVTGKELLELYPKVEKCIPQVDALFAKLIDEGVAIMLDTSESSHDLSNSSSLEKEEDEFTEDNEIDNKEILEDDENILDDTEEYVDVDGISVDDTVSLYFRQMGCVPLLDKSEEVTLARQMEEGKEALAKLRKEDVSLEEERRLRGAVDRGDKARKKLTEANTRLVVSVAKKYTGNGVPFLDLIQEGNIGLMKAVEKFDYRRGYKFSTYATWWIRQGITRALAQQSRLIRIPVHAGDQIRRIYRTIESYEKETGERPTKEEISERTGISVSKIELLMRSSRYPISLEMPVGEDDDSEFGDFIEDDDSLTPTEVTHQHLLREALQKIMTSLSPREARILRLRFGLRDGRAHTLEEVGQKFGLTRERIRQIEHEALDRLRCPYRRRQLMDYLR